MDRLIRKVYFLSLLFVPFIVNGNEMSNFAFFSNPIEEIVYLFRKMGIV